MTSPLLSLRHAVVSYDPALPAALDAVDLELHRGDWVAVCGANGCGKSTLLGVLAGAVPLETGTLTRADARVAALFQEPDNQFVATSARHELALSVPTGLDRSEREGRIADAIARFDLGAVLDRNPHRLSGGEKQRLALATVWLERPDVMLLDEPLAYLDADSRVLVLDFVRTMNTAGAAVVWATPGEDGEWAREAVLLDAGRVAWSGPAAECPLPRGAPPARHRPSAAPLSQTAALVLDNVSFAYAGVPVLGGAGLTVAGGACDGVFGKNSAGKSTLLLVAGGAYPPASGRVTWIPRGERPLYLPQSPERLFFAETVREEIAFGLERRGLPRAEIEKRAAASLSAVGLDPGRFAGRSPFTLSSGEMRRVAFAIAEAMAPGVLLLDEPGSSLDAAGHEALAGVVDRRTRAGSAVVVSSHDRRLLESLCDRVVTLENGRLG